MYESVLYVITSIITIVPQVRVYEISQVVSAMSSPVADHQVDVLVLGGGPAGVIAAVAAARMGLEVLLVESQGCLGGSRTSTGVDTFYGFYMPGERGLRIVGGVAWEIVQRLKQADAAFERPNTYGAGTGITYDVEQLKLLYEQMVVESNAKLLYHTYACRVLFDGHAIQGVVVANKAGLTTIRANYYIDTTGDADVAGRAGVPFEQSAANEIQSLTTIFFMASVDVVRAKQVKHAELVALMKSANASGDYRLPREDGSWHITPHPGVIQANMVRVPGVDPTDPFAVTQAEIEGRRQTGEYVRFLKGKVPGFENAYLLKTSDHIGVRESRRIMGHYRLTEQDVISGAKFGDAIACCAAPIEDHTAGTGTNWAYVEGDGYYHIPYRVLVPTGIDNLIVAGRCLSATHGAQASARNSAQCMAMGEAAGVASSLCNTRGAPFLDVDVAELQRCIVANGGILKV